MQQISTRSDLGPGASGKNEKIGNFRWTICGLLFVSTAINYMDRQILGVLKPQLSHDLRWNEYDYANIVTVFQFTYAFGYLFGGRLMDRFGVKRGLPIAAFVWSVAAATHGLARTLFAFCGARFVLGLAEGSNFPACIRTIGDWFPIKERALATGIFNSASNVGAIICPLTVPWIAVHAGWPMAFYITGGLGFIWIIAWLIIYDRPDTHVKLSSAERRYIEDGQTAYSEAKISWTTLLRMKASWAYMLANVLAGPVWWFYLFWIPDFLHKRFHLSLEKTGFFTGLIYSISLVGSIGGGWLAANLMHRGWDLNRARKAALLIPAVCVIPVCIAATVPSIWIAIAVVGLAAASHQAWSANLYTFVSDTMPKNVVGSVVGLGGFSGGIASMIVAQAVAWVLTKSGSYVPVFIWASTMYLLSLTAIQILVPRINRHESFSTRMPI